MQAMTAARIDRKPGPSRAFSLRGRLWACKRGRTAIASHLRGTAAAGLVDTSRKTRLSLTDEGRTLTLEGPTHPARC
ncbi:hypothetical protein F1090_22320 [Salmonella enterica]|nr:hypothetical protein [Salmonella enterica]